MRPKTKLMYSARRGSIGEENSMRKGLPAPLINTWRFCNCSLVLETSYAERSDSLPVSLMSLLVLARIRTEALVSFPTMK